MPADPVLDLAAGQGGRRPIVMVYANAHLLNVNSAMLRLAGIDAETEVEGVMKFADGTPSGELQEPAAMYLVFKRRARSARWCR